MRSDIVPGGISPGYELPDHTGKVRKLSELQGGDPLIPARAVAVWQLRVDGRPLLSTRIRS